MTLAAGTHTLAVSGGQAGTALGQFGPLENCFNTKQMTTASDVLYAASSILRDADRALGRPHAPERIEAWYDALRPSLFSASGRHRLMRRLGLEEENAEQPGL